MALTKAMMAQHLVENAQLNKQQAIKVVELFFEEIRLALERGEVVKLAKLGNFQTRQKKQRPGRNPKTGEIVPVSARRVVTFHASLKLREEVEKLVPENVEE
jgi:integration host factor subunit alpha